MVKINTICIGGAGTMGSGIAQVSAQSGFNTILFDLNESVLERAKDGIQKNLQFLVGKKKISEEEENKIFQRIKFVNNTNDCIADLIIEAIMHSKLRKRTLQDSKN